MALMTEANRKWWTLGAVCISLFLVNLDATVIVVALPAIQADLQVGLTGLEWIVNAYVLAFAVLLLTGGKLADFLGRRRIFLVGLVVFAASSLACGLAGSSEVLIGARIFQGLGAALMLPATLSIVAAAFPVRERGLALGLWAGVAALALAVGPLVGGLLVDGASWRWIFYINIPVGAVGFAAVRLLVVESRDTAAEQSLDVRGLLAGGIATSALVFGLIEANNYGWGSAQIVLSFAAAAVGYALFVWVELRGRVPMLDLRLFRNSTFAGANAVGLLIMAALYGVLIFLSVYMQSILGYSPLRTGVYFMPMTLLLMLVSPVGGKLSDRIGSRWPMTAGMTIFAAGLFLLSRLGPGWGFWDLLPGLALAGIGFGLTMPPMTAALLASVRDDQAGVASGVLNTFRQAGGALGLAVVGAIVAASVGSAASGPAYGDAFVSGLGDAFVVAAVVALAGAAVAAATIGRPGLEPVETEPTPAA